MARPTARKASATPGIERPKSPSRAGAPVAGVGGGTAFIAFANHLPDNNRFKFWLLLAAPAISILGSRLWSWGEARFWDRMWDRQFEKNLRIAKDFFERELQKPDLDKEEQQKLKDQLSDLRAVESSRLLNRVRATVAFQNVNREWRSDQA